MSQAAWLAGLMVCVALPALGQTAAGSEPFVAPAAVWTGERDHPAPVDYGLGPNVRPWRTTTAATLPKIALGGPTAATQGAFGAPIAWPLVAIHVVLLQDGRVLSYGSDAQGNQGAQFIYDVWDPAQGSGSNAHLVLPNTTATDMFCSAQQVLWSSGAALITGGDLTIARKRNYSQNQVELFQPQGNTLASLSPMQYARWYPTMVPLPDGEMLVLGGRSDPVTPVLTPEVFNPATGWRTLGGASSAVAFGSTGYNWYYPRGFVTSSGNVMLTTNTGQVFSIGTGGAGSIAQVPAAKVSSFYEAPGLLFAPDQILLIHSNGATGVLDASGPVPVFAGKSSLSQARIWSSGTVMADGRVVVTGGSLVANQLTGVAYAAEIWSPATGAWTLGASATKPRLYHSNALLLPDATVLTVGGGAPGPVTNLNGEIYYPPYLYRTDGSGLPADRPTLSSVPALMAPGGTLTGTVGVGQAISAVTFVRAGSATHSTNLDQVFLSLPFSQSGTQIAATLPGNPNVLLPGHYLMFVFDSAGVPSLASIVLVPAVVGDANRWLRPG